MSAAASRSLDACVVILNYNGGELLERVVAAVERSQGVSLGIAVVDNASRDDSMQGLAARTGAGSPLLLRMPCNLGYAAGNNLGVFGFAARYVVLLNNDALVEPSTLATLVRFMDAHPRAGACGPALLWPDGAPQAFSHGDDPTPRYLARRALARRTGRDLHSWGGTEPLRTGWVAGTCMVLRRDALSQVGLLDARIFMYFEDNDLCLRLRRQRWDVYLVPAAHVRHFNRVSYGDRARVRRYYRGLTYFYRKHYGLLPSLLVGAAARVRGLLRPGT